MPLLSGYVKNDSFAISGQFFFAEITKLNYSPAACDMWIELTKKSARCQPL